MTKVGQIISTHLYFQNDDGNPLNVWPPNPNNNYWVEISSYNRINDPEVLKLVLARTTAFDKQIDDKTVIRSKHIRSTIATVTKLCSTPAQCATRSSKWRNISELT
jgi:hypothetical protein